MQRDHECSEAAQSVTTAAAKGLEINCMKGPLKPVRDIRFLPGKKPAESSISHLTQRFKFKTQSLNFADHCIDAAKLKAKQK
jgi:hypothetical protein